MSTIRVCVAGSHDLKRAALAAALAGEPDLLVVGEAGSGSEAVGGNGTTPDVVVVTAAADASAAADACSQVKRRAPTVKVLVLCAGHDPRVLLAAVEAGADGFVSEEQGVDELCSALRRMQQGEAIVPPAMLGPLLKGLILRARRREQAIALSMRLTPREKQVLALLADGCDHEAVADILVISPQTARTHIQNVLGKLEVHSRLEAAALAIEHDLVDHALLRRAQ